MSRPSLASSDTLLQPLAAITFLIFFNGFMMAPLIPSLAQEFHMSVQKLGWVVPAYMLTYGFSTLIYGPLSDRFGRARIVLTQAFLFMCVTLAMSQVSSYPVLIALRVLSGLCAGGVLPIALALIGDLYPYERLGRPMGWMFGAVAGGTAFGSTFGAWLNPYLGWRREFLFLSAACAVAFAILWRRRALLAHEAREVRSIGEILQGYQILLFEKGRVLFAIIFLNGIFHSGVFSWLGYYFSTRYALSDDGIGKALIGYGLPGMMLGPMIGKLADRFGRGRIIPLGFALASLCAWLLIANTPIAVVIAITTLLSLGFDMTHPLMSGLAAALDPKRRGQAMGLNAFAIFAGYGMGSLLFQFLLLFHMNLALGVFASLQLILALVAFRVFKREMPLRAA